MNRTETFATCDLSWKSTTLKLNLYDSSTLVVLCADTLLVGEAGLTRLTININETNSKSRLLISKFYLACYLAPFLSHHIFGRLRTTDDDSNYACTKLYTPNHELFGTSSTFDKFRDKFSDGFHVVRNDQLLIRIYLTSHLRNACV